MHVDENFAISHSHRITADGLQGAGNILAFNNGWEFRGYERGWSSVVEIATPVEGSGYRPVEPAPVWTYEADPPTAFYAAAQSGAQRLPNGNTLICGGSLGTVFEVTPDGRIVWEYVNAQNNDGRMRQGELAGIARAEPLILQNRLYRAERYAPGYPGLQALDLTPKGTVEIYPEP